MKKVVFSFLMVTCALSLSAHAEGKNGTKYQSWKWGRKLSSAVSEPCAADKGRIKDVAATSFGEVEIDMAHHKIVVSKGDLMEDGVFTTMANDAAVVSFSGKVAAPGSPDKMLFLTAKAICSPKTEKYELMLTSWDSVANVQ